MYIYRNVTTFNGLLKISINTDWACFEPGLTKPSRKKYLKNQRFYESFQMKSIFLSWKKILLFQMNVFKRIFVSKIQHSSFHHKSDKKLVKLLYVGIHS